MSERRPVRVGIVREGHIVEFIDVNETGEVSTTSMMGITGERSDSGIRIRITGPVDLVRNREMHLVVGNSTFVFDWGRSTVTQGGIGHLQDTITGVGGHRLRKGPHTLVPGTR